jgi:hypothetical protein
MPDTYIWAYGVVPADHTGVREPGIDGAAVERVEDRELAVLTSRVVSARYSDAALRQRLEDMATVETLARAHDAVLEAALRAGDVLPFRLCTLYETPDAARDMLAAKAAMFGAALDRLRGKAEWGVKVFVKPAAEAVATGAPASGTEYLVRRRAERAAVAASGEAVEQAAAEIHARLVYAAGAGLTVRPQDRRLSGRAEEMILNGAYLVARDAADDFRAAVSTLADHYAGEGLELSLTGPWPAYNFAREVPA